MNNDTYIIQGGTPLIGSIDLAGAKNASIKLLIASLLLDGETVLRRIPLNQDNVELVNLFHDIGVGVKLSGHTATIDAKNINKSSVNLLYGSKIRSSFLLFGPLVYRFGEAHIPNPGGCRIGARPIERIIKGISALGVDIRYNHGTGYYDAKRNGKIEGEYTFEKPTHTGTEALILLGVCGTGVVTLHNCALEPEIDDLITFLNDCGAKINRKGKDIQIEAVASLRQQHPHTVIEDRNEAVTYAAMAYVTGGDITINNLHPIYIQAFIDKVHQAGGQVDVLGEVGVRFKSIGRLQATDIQTAPHPGYMTDWQPQWGLMMATASGVSIIHETMLEARLNYVQELQKVGAKIDFFQPEVTHPELLYQFNYDPRHKYLQAIRITGVDKLHNGVMTVHDLRAGAVVVMAGLSAQHESVIYGAQQIERGYEHLVDKITSLGGNIQRT